LRSKGQRSRSQGRPYAHSVNAEYLRNGKAYELQTWYTDGARRPASPTSAVTSNDPGIAYRWYDFGVKVRVKVRVKTY